MAGEAEGNAEPQQTGDRQHGTASGAPLTCGLTLGPPDFYMRLHGPTKASTLGVGGMIVGSLLFFSTRGEGLSLHEFLIVIFLFITAPVSAHIVAKAALHLQLPAVERTRRPGVDRSAADSGKDTQN